MKAILWILIGGALLLSTVPASVAQLAQDDSVPAVAEEPETPAATAPAATTDNVRRALFATDVVEREPVDEVDSLSTAASEICFFTEIVDFAGGSITHRWIHDGETLAEVTFDIGGPRWRVYSRKQLHADQAGEWMVEIVDGSGNTVETASFLYREGEKPTPEPEQESAQGWEQ